MKFEKRFSIPKRELYKIIGKSIVFTAIAYLGLIAPIQNYEATKRITKNLIFGTPISCVVPEQKNTNLVLVSPGAGFYIDSNTDQYMPSSAEDMRLRAMAVQYLHEVKTRPDIKVVIQDGVLPEGMQKDIDVPLLKKYVDTESGGKTQIDDSNIIVDQTSINTSSGMPILKDIMKSINADQAVFVDSLSHGDRTTEDACENGIPSRWIAAEEVVGKVDPKVETSNKKNPPIGTFGIRLKEKTEMALNVWFPGGWETVPAKNLANSYFDMKKIYNKSSPDYGHRLLPLVTIILALSRLRKYRKQKK